MANTPREKKERTIKARLPDALRDRLDEIHARHDTDDTKTLLRLLTAWCDEVERVDAVRWPIRIEMAPARVATETLLRAADDPALYDAPKLGPGIVMGAALKAGRGAARARTNRAGGKTS